tara:strand:+ start:13474 stop:14352 length:879 start_codon:yes stop_codon:yes gene_type:complete
MLIDHLEKLKYFFEVANTGSFNKAAGKLFITQPTLTKSIKVLEADLEKSLFIRTPKGVHLTEEGNLLFKYCLQLFDQLESIEKGLTKKDEMSGDIRVGTYDSISQYFWPDFIINLKKKYPDINIQLETNRSRTIQQQLVNGDYDLALTIEPTESRYIKVIAIDQDYFDFYCANTTHFKDMANAPLIYMPSAISNFDNQTQNKIINYNSNSYKTNSLESVKALTKKGLGIGLLPSHVAKELVAEKKIKKVQLAKIGKISQYKHEIGLSISMNKMELPIFKMLVNEIREQFKAT